MALMWIDGFDHYGTGSGGGRDAMLDGVWASISSSSFPTATRARTGGISFQLGSGTVLAEAARRILPEEVGVVGVGYGLWMNELPNTNNTQVLGSVANNGNTPRITISISTTGQLRLHSGWVNDTVVYTTPTPVIVAGSWQHLEMRFATNGSVEVRWNGITVVDTSVSPAGSGLFAQLRLGPRVDFEGNFRTMWIDDLFAWNDDGTVNNDFLGDMRVHTAFPDSDTVEADWEPVGQALGYECINETSPNDDTDYIQSEDPAETSRFGIEDLPTEVATIRGVQTYTRMRKTQAGSCNIQAGLVSNGVESAGLDRPITTEWTYWQDVFEEDPDTGGPWTRESLNAAQLRLRRTG